MLLALLITGLGALLAPAARAEGPGYGGGADTLTVSWQPAGTAKAAGTAPGTGGRGAGVAAADLTAEASGLELTVDGVGFRGRSAVEVRVGSAEPLATRADATGTLNVGVPARTADVAGTGTSVVATGRSPSGTSMTLVGAIPPKPTGTGPVDLVPWLAAAVVVGMAGSWLVGRGRDQGSNR